MRGVNQEHPLLKGVFEDQINWQKSFENKLLNKWLPRSMLIAVTGMSIIGFEEWTFSALKPGPLPATFESQYLEADDIPLAKEIFSHLHPVEINTSAARRDSAHLE